MQKPTSDAGSRGNCSLQAAGVAAAAAAGGASSSSRPMEQQQQQQQPAALTHSLYNLCEQLTPCSKAPRRAAAGGGGGIERWWWRWWQWWRWWLGSGGGVQSVLSRLPTSQCLVGLYRCTRPRRRGLLARRLCNATWRNAPTPTG